MGRVMDRVRRLLGLTPGNLFAPYLIGSLILTAFVVVAMAVGLGFGIAGLYVWTAGLTLGSVALFFVGVFVVAARREAADALDLLSGEIWARWHYDAADNE